jgi:hypothetical protein
MPGREAGNPESKARNFNRRYTQINADDTGGVVGRPRYETRRLDFVDELADRALCVEVDQDTPGHNSLAAIS